MAENNPDHGSEYRKGSLKLFWLKWSHASTINMQSRKKVKNTMTGLI